VTFAIETGPEPAAVLKRLLDAADSPGVGVNLDPANLVMVTGDDPVAAARLLGPRVVHTHAKDGRKLQACDAAEVYGAFADGGFAQLEKRMGRLFEEVPLGAARWTGPLPGGARRGRYRATSPSSARPARTPPRTSARRCSSCATS